MALARRAWGRVGGREREERRRCRLSVGGEGGCSSGAAAVAVRSDSGAAAQGRRERGRQAAGAAGALAAVGAGPSQGPAAERGANHAHRLTFHALYLIFQWFEVGASSGLKSGRLWFCTGLPGGRLRAPETAGPESDHRNSPLRDRTAQGTHLYAFLSQSVQLFLRDRTAQGTHLWFPSLPVLPDYCECEGN